LLVKRALAIASAAATGLLAGGNLDRLSVQLPAFKRIGAQAWADYSRNADLSANGLALYPLEGIAAAALTIATAATTRKKSASIAAAFATIGLTLTIKAAPNILRLRNLSDDEVELRRAYDGFRFWSTIRGAFQIAAFFASLASL